MKIIIYICLGVSIFYFTLALLSYLIPNIIMSYRDIKFRYLFKQNTKKDLKNTKEYKRQIKINKILK